MTLSLDAKPSPILLSGLPANSRVLVAEAWDATPHLETGLEIALRLAPSLSKVYYCHFGKALPICECSRRLAVTPIHRLLGYNKTPSDEGIQIALKYAALHGLNFESISPPDNALSINYAIGQDYLDSIIALQRACFEGSPVFGVSIASSLVSMTENSQVSPREYEAIVNKLAASFARSYYIANYVIEEGEIDAIVLFNGRFASIKGAVLAAQMQGIPIYYHERGSSKDLFSLRCYQPHDRVAIQQEISITWENSRSGRAKAIAEDFFRSKRLGNDTAWTSFKQGMQSGHVNSCIDIAKKKSKTGKIVTFFSSSEDEFISIGDAFERSCFEWSGQVEAFKAVAKSAEKHGHALILRNHPHLQKKAAADRLKWDTLSFMNNKHQVVVVESGSPVDTNELIEASDLIVVHGSTVGIESVFCGKPVITVSDSFYDSIGASIYKPKTLECLDSLISSPSRLVVSPESALPYGYYMATHGSQHQLYQPATLFRGKFLGYELCRTTKRHELMSAIKKNLKKLS
jgi:hypothetical protein